MKTAVTEGTLPEENPDHDLKTCKGKLIFLFYLLILVLSVVGGAFIGPINNMLPCKDKTMLI